MKSLFLSLLGTLAVSFPASASPLFSDNFGNGIADVFNWNGGTNWTILNGGTVDLIGNGGSFNLIPGNGNFVDLDGSTSNAGQFATQMMFPAGTYLVEFSLGGSQRGSDEEVAVSLGNWSTLIKVRDRDPFTPFSFIITTTGGRLQFQNENGNGSPNVGALLDNVSVSTAVIPEPATLAIFGGLTVVGVLGTRRRKTAV